MKNICTVFALANVLRGHLKNTGDDEDSRALQDLIVVIMLSLLFYFFCNQGSSRLVCSSVL